MCKSYCVVALVERQILLVTSTSFYTVFLVYTDSITLFVIPRFFKILLVKISFLKVGASLPLSYIYCEKQITSLYVADLEKELC